MNWKSVQRVVLGFLAFGLAGSVSAQDMEWKQVFFEDFGGNETDAPVFGQELSSDIVNGDLDFFSQGDESYGNDYSVVKYYTGSNNWHKGGDHTHASDKSSGYFLLVNPDQSQDVVTIYRFKLTGICSGVTFKFSAWMANLMLVSGSGNLPVLSIGIYKDKDATELVMPTATKKLELPKCTGADPNALDWQELSMEFKMTGNQDYAYFIVAAVQPESNGFDFAVDDIKIEVMQPSIDINLPEFEYGMPAKITASFENNNFFADMSTVKYTWEYSKDSVNFSPLTSGYYKYDKNYSYSIPSFDKDVDNGYYRLTIGDEGSMDSPVCSLQKCFRINETKNKKAVHLCEGQVLIDNGTVLNAAELYDGQVYDANPNYTYIIHIMEVKEKTGVDKYLCVGEAYEGVVYDTEQIVPIDEVITSVEYGCDSVIIKQNLIVSGPRDVILEDLEVCQGGRLVINGVERAFNESGTITLEYQDGCFNYIQNVIVHPIYKVEDTQIVCQGQTYKGKVYNEAGTFPETYNYQSQFGCDSVITTTVVVTAIIEAQLDDVTLCEGESYTFGDKTYSAPGVYDLSNNDISLMSGCDSITYLHLEIYPTYSNEAKPRDTTICYGSQLFGKVYTEDDVRRSPFLVKDPHVYTTIHGCDSSVYYNVTVLQIQLSLSVKSDRNTVCRGEEVEIDVADLKPADTPLAWSHVFGGTDKKAVFTPDKDLVCVVLASRQVSNTERCETSDTVYIYVRDSPILTIESVDQKENIVEYSVEGGTEPYKIVLDKKEVGTDASGQLLNSFIGIHTLTATDQNSCSSSDRFEIAPVPITPAEIVTPNGDGVNDTWTIENIDVYGKARVRIMNRYGKVLVEYNGYDNEHGWDGYYNGHILPATDYWYEINLPEIDTQYVGHFTLFYSQE